MTFHQGSFYSCLVPKTGALHIRAKVPCGHRTPIATYTLSAGGRDCSALFICPKSTKVSFGDPDSPHNLTESLYKSQYLLNKHAAQRHVANCTFDQTTATYGDCLSFACLFLFPTSTIVSCGGPYANSRRTPTQSVGVLATGRRRHKK